MAKEREIKILIPSGADLSSVVPENFETQQITQVYLSPKKSTIKITKHENGIEIGFSLVGAERSSVLLLNDTENMKVCQELVESQPEIIGKLGKVNFDGQDTEIRIRTMNDKAFLTIKKKSGIVGVRGEFEFEIPPQQAELLQGRHIADGTAKIEKSRISWMVGESKYEIDMYAGGNDGLMILEIENPPANLRAEAVFPGAKDVTNDKKYGNRALASAPYSAWQR